MYYGPMAAKIYLRFTSKVAPWFTRAPSLKNAHLFCLNAISWFRPSISAPTCTVCAARDAIALRQNVGERLMQRSPILEHSLDKIVHIVPQLAIGIDDARPMLTSGGIGTFIEH